MTLRNTLVLLFIAALLEAGGDAIVRHGLKSSSGGLRLTFFGVGALVLFAYAYVVNSPPWDFGKLLGVYVVFFFIAAQLISFFVFHVSPKPAVWVGGLFIIAGGAIVSLAK